MAFELEQVIHESHLAIQNCARAYAVAVAEQDVLAALVALQKLDEVVDAAIAVYVIVVGGVVGARAEAEEPHT